MQSLSEKDTYLNIQLKNDETGERMELQYRMLRDSVARRFEFLVHRHLTFQNEIQSVAWAVFPAGDDPTMKTYNSLKQHIDFINTYKKDGKYIYQFENVLPDFDKITQQVLSNFHAEFETMLTKVSSTSTGEQNSRNRREDADPEMLMIEEHLNGVNGKIHSLEHLISRQHGDSSSWFSAFLYGEFDEERLRRYQFKEKDYTKFSLGCKWGDLLLGYGTTGKSLWHIYKGEINYDISVDLAPLYSQPNPTLSQTKTLS